MNNNIGQGSLQFKNSNFPVVAIASSAGGLAALTILLHGLKADFPAAILIVQHLARHHHSVMAEILSRRTELVVIPAKLNEKIQAGHVYIAPPDYHLLLNRDSSISLTQSELVHFVRPSADLLFESVAASFKENAIAVVLTGTGSDGAMGVKAIKKMGGIVIVQSPETADFPGMPESAIQTGVVDKTLPLEKISFVLTQLLQPKSGMNSEHE